MLWCFEEADLPLSIVVGSLPENEMKMILLLRKQVCHCLSSDVGSLAENENENDISNNNNNKYIIYSSGSVAWLQIGSQAATDTCNEPKKNRCTMIT